MKVLLVSSTMNEEACNLFGLPKQVYGGWMNGTIDGLKKFQDIQLEVGTFHQEKECRNASKNGASVIYHDIQYRKPADLKPFFHNHKYDIMHVFGVENEVITDLEPYFDYERTLFSIQGMMSPIKKVYCADCENLPEASGLFKTYLKLNQHILTKREQTEKCVLQKARYIANRTKWGSTEAIHEGFTGQDFYLGETLREPFYQQKGSWNVNNIRKHQIFISQGNYPIKGAHKAIQIVERLKQIYPDVQCRIGGENVFTSSSMATSLGISYASFIRKMVKNRKLENFIQYIGLLSAEQVVRELTNCNVFLLPSAIENSPNSLQEAMLIGCPCVSSEVGGVPSLVTNREECLLYPFEDVEEGASCIKAIFEDDGLAQTLSKNGTKQSEQLTDLIKNAETLHEIYSKIVSEKGNCYE